jgi:predicted N-acetyltransferase YhbS
MEVTSEYEAHAAAISDLFAATFTASEGTDEGALIGQLARRLMEETPAQDLRAFTAWKRGELVGAILFSRLIYKGDKRTVFVLGPVAVATDRQNQGFGQRLISHGIEVLRQEGVELAVTYGDPSFYRRVGFEVISQDDVPAPFSLQQPEGWLGQSLNGAPLTPLKGPSRCVPAFNDPAFW